MMCELADSGRKLTDNGKGMMAVANVMAVERAHTRCQYDFPQLVCPLRILVVMCGLLYAWLACGGSVRSLGWPTLAVVGAWLGAAVAWRVWGMLHTVSSEGDAPERPIHLAKENRVVVVAAPNELRRLLEWAGRAGGVTERRFRAGLRRTQERVLLSLFPLIVLGVRPMMDLTERETGLIGLATYATAYLEVLVERKRCVVSSGKVTMQTLSGVGVARELSINLAEAMVILDYAEGIGIVRGVNQQLVLELGDFWCPHRLGAAILRASQDACRADGADVSKAYLGANSATNASFAEPASDRCT